MRVIARIGMGLLICVLAGRAAAEERWRIKFEHEAPQKILVPPHVPPGLEPYFGQKAYWYVLYKITNLSNVKIGNGNPLSLKKDDLSGPRMCLKIWVETDADRRLVRPFAEDRPGGVEGFEYDEEKDSYPGWDEAAGRSRWGGSRGAPMPNLRGAGACYVDGYFPIVHDAIAERHGYKPKHTPSDRFAKGPNAALPVLADCFDVNEPLEPGQSRLGCAIFSDFPVEEYELFYDALNLLAVFSEDRRNEHNTRGFNHLRRYKELFPEGMYIEQVNALLEMENASRGSSSADDGLCKAVEKAFADLRGGFDGIGDDDRYKSFTEEIGLLTRAARDIYAFRIQEATEALETFRQKFKKSNHWTDADRLYTFVKQNLIAEARDEALKVLRKNDPVSIPDEADRIYVKISGISDPVLKEGNMVYADEPVLILVYHRRGDPSYRFMQPLKLIEERLIPGERRALRKIARTRVGEY